MIEIERAPIKKLVVHELYKYKSKEELMERVVRPNEVLPLYWSDGVLFMFFPLGGNDAKREYLKGILHVHMVGYCVMQEYKRTLELDNEEFKGVKIRVADLSEYEIFKDLAKWLKKQ